MLRILVSWVVLCGCLLAVAACPCCPQCAPEACPCACPTCGQTLQIPPNQVLEPVPEVPAVPDQQGTVQPFPTFAEESTSPTQPPSTTPKEVEGQKCGEGYALVTSGIPLENDLGSEEDGDSAVDSCDACAGQCSSSKACHSYQCLTKVKQCSLSKRKKPVPFAGGIEDEYAFCVKVATTTASTTTAPATSNLPPIAIVPKVPATSSQPAAPPILPAVLPVTQAPASTTGGGGGGGFLPPLPITPPVVPMPATTPPVVPMPLATLPPPMVPGAIWSTSPTVSLEPTPITCAEGYTVVLGGLPLESESKTPQGEDVTTCQDCEDRCTEDTGCMSYECLPDLKKCSVSQHAEPVAGTEGISTFCSKAASTAVSTMPPASTTAPGTPPMSCKLNCYGEAAVPIELKKGNKTASGAESLEDCRQQCRDTEGCKATVWGRGQCYGKKEIHTSKCQKGDGSFLTEFISEMPFGTCTIMGDPHILTFDNPNGAIEDTTQLEAGVYSLVNSPELEIQGFFGFSSRFPSASSLTALGISGILLKGNRLTVYYKGPPGVFALHWNNKSILEGHIGESFEDDGVFAVSGNMDPEKFSHAARHTIGGTAASGDLPSYLFKIEPGIRIYILLGKDTMNAVITMRKLQGGQDGYCGNFDCNAENDVLTELMKRGEAAPLPNAISLFNWLPPNFMHKNQTTPPHGTKVGEAEAPNLQNCPDKLLKKAGETCAHIQEPGKKDDCVFDVCASGSAEAGKLDLAADALTEAVQSKAAWLGFSFMSSIPLWVHACCAVALFGGIVVRVSLGRTAHRRLLNYSPIAVDDGEGKARDVWNGHLRTEPGDGEEFGAAETQALLQSA